MISEVYHFCVSNLMYQSKYLPTRPKILIKFTRGRPSVPRVLSESMSCNALRHFSFSSGLLHVAFSHRSRLLHFLAMEKHDSNDLCILFLNCINFYKKIHTRLESRFLCIYEIVVVNLKLRYRILFTVSFFQVEKVFGVFLPFIIPSDFRS